MTMQALQEWIDNATATVNTSIEQLLGLDAPKDSKLQPATGSQVLDFGIGSKPSVLPSNATGGVDESDTLSIVKGIVVEQRPKRQIRLSGREMEILPSEEAELGAPSVKRVICGVCHKNNEVPARTCLLDCGACGTRNFAGDDLAVRIQCYACNALNLAEPDAGCITCARCGVAIDLLGEDRTEDDTPPALDLDAL